MTASDYLSQFSADLGVDLEEEDVAVEIERYIESVATLIGAP